MGRHERLAALAEVGSDGLVVADLGCGTGRTVRALLAGEHVPATVHAVAHASQLGDDLLQDARVRSRVPDLDEPLPFGSGSLDRVVSMNGAENLVRPDQLLGECHRVLRPGGLAVVGHTDFDTALFTSDDDALTRLLVDRFVRVVPWWQDSADGFMGRKLLQLAAGSPFELVEVRSWAD